MSSRCRMLTWCGRLIYCVSWIRAATPAPFSSGRDKKDKDVIEVFVDWDVVGLAVEGKHTATSPDMKLQGHVERSVGLYPAHRCRMQAPTRTLLRGTSLRGWQGLIRAFHARPMSLVVVPICYRAWTVCDQLGIKLNADKDNRW